MQEKSLTEQLRKKEYLIGKTLIEREFKASYPDEYELCVFCWCRISNHRKDDDEGFFEKESGNWICRDCVKKYSASFAWNLLKSRKKTFIELLEEQEDFEIPMI